ncbi:MAG: metal ABC transporter permease, partial [Thermodesulfobacteriota bacterium]
MKVVGILLVAAMIIIPAAAGLQIARSFRQAIWFSALISMFTVTAGLVTAALWDLPPAGTIVVLSTLVFLAFLVLRRSVRG